MILSPAKVFRLYRDAYSGHPKEIWALAGLTVINRFGTMVLPFLSVYLTTILGYSFKEAGVLISAFGFGSLAGSYIGGKLSDRLGPNLVIINSLLISGFLFICLQFFFDFYSLFALIFVTALFGEAYRPAMMASVGEHVPKSEAGRTMSLLRLAVNLGMSMGPAVAGFVAVTAGYNWLFWIDGITCISAAILFAIISMRWKKRAAGTIEKKQTEPDITTLPPHKNKNFLLYLLSTLLGGFAFMQWFHTAPVFIKTEWAFDERYIGTLLGLSSLLIILVEVPLTHILEKTGRAKAAIRLGVFLIGISFLAFLLPNALVWCFVSVFVWTTGEMLFLPFNSASAIKMSPSSQRGAYMAGYWMTWSLANILAPLIGLGFAEELGFSTFWWCVFGVAMLSIMLHIWLGDRVEH